MHSSTIFHIAIMVSGLVWLNDKDFHHLVQGELWRAWPGFRYHCSLLLTIFTSPPWFQALSDWLTRLFTIWSKGSYDKIVIVPYYCVLFGVKTFHLQVAINFVIQFMWQGVFLHYYVGLQLHQPIVVINSCNKFLLQIFFLVYKFQFVSSCSFSVLAFLPHLPTDLNLFIRQLKRLHAFFQFT